jgi:hypothetical protein
LFARLMGVLGAVACMEYESMSSDCSVHSEKRIDASDSFGRLEVDSWRRLAFSQTIVLLLLP